MVRAASYGHLCVSFFAAYFLKRTNEEANKELTKEDFIVKIIK